MVKNLVTNHAKFSKNKIGGINSRSIFLNEESHPEYELKI